MIWLLLHHHHRYLLSLCIWPSRPSPSPDSADISPFLHTLLLISSQLSACRSHSCWHFRPSTAFLSAMAFAGTQQKCKACEKTVYLVDQLTADGAVFHKACFRCNHCKGTLKLSNYSSFEGTLYCKPHFDQLFKRTGSLEKSFETGVHKTSKLVDRGLDNELKTPTKFSSIFSGTQEKCIACGKTVYPIEKVSVDGMTYHKSCFKCCHGGCSLSPSNHIAHEGRLYCRHHHAQLFKEKGNYSQLEKVPAVKAIAEEDGNL